MSTVASHDLASAIYQGSVYRASLSGSLIKRESAGAGAATVWDAGTLLSQRVEPRQIFTANAQGNLVPFLWSDLDAMQRALLDRSSSTLPPDGLGERRVHYLHGARVDESGQPGGIFPRRDSIMGAVIHGLALRVGPPTGGVQTEAYRSFSQVHRDRRAVVYVGTAGGMLHAFDDASGKELFAYIPHAVLDSLPALTQGPRFGVVAVDGGMAAADVVANGEWRTVLVAGLGRSARGAAVLDITDPAQFGNPFKLLWEFTDRDDPDMDHMIGKPVIARFRTGSEKGVTQYAYFAMLASGVNNKRGSGSNALFLLSLDKKPSEAWKGGVNYFKFVTPAGEQSRANGMLELASVAGADGAVEYAYAGDLQGNLWRFDFSAGLPWGKAKGETPDLLLVAQDALGQRQPIMQKPAIAFAPGGGMIVLFGTGRYLSRQDLDLASFSTQSFYAVLDRAGASTVQRDALVPRKLIKKNAGNSFVLEGDGFVYGTSGSGKRGWYFDFPQSATTGERVLSASILSGADLVFYSMTPAPKQCDAPIATLYVLNTLSGLAADVRPSNASLSGGMPGSILLRSAGYHKTSTTDIPGPQSVKSRVQILTGDRPVLELDLPGNVAPTFGRLSWRELVNWGDLQRSGSGQP
ncbi:MAG: PilC/PilY family type IV pilus protein [Oxalicibacterium faecigallinarum]|uniref:pilus assembly protein n=1 Tax=Oxalicibacterium faecigallinarum TaxID=573741 RepID=UPI002808FCFA|nr:PilC/PilY family type IV pilus protein [Oxalicibacterium faecigallinarum]MDQ7969466.1 PilC/PilY family type IV pilus protein [Oxalicibacterium faecigallinarum]